MRPRVGAVILCLAFVTAPALAADGWSIARDGKACVATGPSSGNATLSIAAMPSQFLLFFESSDFPVEQQSRAVILRFDGGSMATVEALGSDRVYGITIIRPISESLRTATQVELQVAQKRYPFELKNTGAAMDEVARCAGVKPFAEQWSNPPRPIPDAPGWQLIDGLAGTDACTARRESTELNTSLVIAKDGTLVLVAGRADWAKWGGEVKGSLRIDDAPAQEFVAFGLQSIVMWPVKDDVVVASLRRAKFLLWHLPWGDFRGEVTGLGAAADALKTCKAPPG